MIVDLLDEWATRLETLALPQSVIAAEARQLAALARQEVEATRDLVNAAVTTDDDASKDDDAEGKKSKERKRS
jgi:hypothetical protein